MPPDQSSSSLNNAALSALTSKGGDTLGAMAADLLGTHASGAMLLGILNSRTVQDDLINSFDLRRVYREKRYVDAREVLAKRTTISEDHKSGIITLTVQDTDKQRVVQLARAYIDELNKRVSDLTTSAAHRERVFLEGRLEKVKQDLDASSLQLSKFSSKNLTFDPQMQGKAMLEAASALQGQLIAAETELSGLRQIYGAENARVRAAEARVGELRRRLNQLSGAGANASGKLQTGEPYPSLEQLPLLGNTYFDLYRRTKIDETIYELLNRQYELAKVEEAKEIPSIKVLDEPVVPERKSWPPRLLIISLGTVFAAGIAVSWLVGKKMWQGIDPRHPYKLLAQRGFAILMNGR
jgi:capsule polysaccharide export protein KpsE/RkpR